MVTDISHYEELAGFFGILANPTRLRILDVLYENGKRGQAGTCVRDIVKGIDLPQPYISKHLKVLRESNIVDFKREGNRLVYSFSGRLHEKMAAVFSYVECLKCC